MYVLIAPYKLISLRTEVEIAEVRVLRSRVRSRGEGPSHDDSQRVGYTSIAGILALTDLGRSIPTIDSHHTHMVLASFTSYVRECDTTSDVPDDPPPGIFRWRGWHQSYKVDRLSW